MTLCQRLRRWWQGRKPVPIVPLGYSYNFESRFRHASEVGVPYVAGDGNWRQQMRGRDGQTGDLWLDATPSSDLPGAGETSFRYQVSQYSRLADYIETRIWNTTKPYGDVGPVLRMGVFKDDPVNADLTRNKFIIIPDTGTVMSRGYGKFWIRFQPSLGSVLTAGGWRELFSFNSAANTGVLYFVLEATADNVFRWKLAEKPDENDPDTWALTDTTRPKIGEWFKVEHAWHPNYIGVKLDDAILLERSGPLAHLSEGANFWHAVSCYSNATQLNRYIYQDVADVHFKVGYDGFPTGEW